MHASNSDLSEHGRWSEKGCSVLSSPLHSSSNHQVDSMLYQSSWILQRTIDAFMARTNLSFRSSELSVLPLSLQAPAAVLSSCQPTVQSPVLQSSSPRSPRSPRGLVHRWSSPSWRSPLVGLSVCRSVLADYQEVILFFRFFLNVWSDKV